ncbi:MAG: thiolase family protein [Chloroflexi bacterium]|nr:thiolase family protein [Chloroflexota bacterium]
MKLRDAVAVVGIGETRYSRSSGTTSVGLNLQASAQALGDAGLDAKAIDGIVVPALVGATAEDLSTNFGIDTLRYTANVHMGGAGPVAALQHALLALSSGLATHVLVSFGYNGYSDVRLGRRPPTLLLGDSPSYRRNYEAVHGLLVPSQFYALWCTRYLHERGWRDTLPLAEVAVTQRAHALLNDNAIMQTPLTVEEHQSSRLISYPLRLLDCSQETDGAGAIVLTTAERARDLQQQPIYLMGVAEGHPPMPDQLPSRQAFLHSGLREAAPRAFAMAEITPGDVDVAELYDAFTFLVPYQLEELGLSGPGEGAAFVMEGKTKLGGALPVNTHGGLLSQAHIWGMSHLVEAVKQLRGSAGRAQVSGAEIALVTGSGDFGDGSVAILRR